MYFKNFPQLYYNFTDLGIRVVRDITANVRPISSILEKVVYYEQYNIDGDDTPEIIAERIYGNPTLHWVLMLVNEKYDYLEDWPMPEWKLSEYVEAKYGVGNANQIHKIYGRDHYETPEGRIVDSNHDMAIPVTNEEYERRVNDSKRTIKIVSPSLINNFITDLENLFQ